VKENTWFARARTVEVLLSGYFLALGENSSFRLLTNRPSIRGWSYSAARRSGDRPGHEDDNVTVVSRDATPDVPRAGLYAWIRNPAPSRSQRLRRRADWRPQVEVRRKDLGLTGETASLEKFDAEDTDSLDNWSHRRGICASANVYAQVRTGQLHGLSSNSWPGTLLRMYTFLPMGGRCSAPTELVLEPDDRDGAYYNPPFVGARSGSAC